MNIIFANLNINAKIIKICVHLNAMFNNIFNNNKSKYEFVKIWSRTLSCIALRVLRKKERSMYGRTKCILIRT